MLQEKKNFVRGENNTSEMFACLSIREHRCCATVLLAADINDIYPFICMYHNERIANRIEKFLKD